MNFIYNFISLIEIKSYDYFVKNKSIPIFYYPVFILKGFLSLIESLIRNISGPFGLIIRRFYYKLIFKNMGKDVLIDVGVIFNGAHNINCKNKIWFDSYSIVNSPHKEVKIGNNVHIGHHCYLGGRESIILEDFTALAASSKIFSGSIKIPPKNKLIPNPMIHYKNSKKFSKYGKVTIKNNAVILANSIVGPATIMEKGSILLPNSVLNKDTKSFSIYSGNPAILVGVRPKN